MALVFEQGQTILFQGDSITDCGRGREAPGALGNGYAATCAFWLQAACPALGLNFLNRGISGNRAKDLVERWQMDCLDLRPDWVSILIGINDTWRAFDAGDPTSTDTYEAEYHSLLEDCRAAGMRLILCEPFLLPTPPDREQWRPDLDPRIQVVRKLAREFHAIYVPFDAAFAVASTQQPPAFWAGDGVHPTRAGHSLMAQTWLRAVGALD